MEFQRKIGITKASYNPYSPHSSFQNPHNLVSNCLSFQELLDMRHLWEFKPKAISPPCCSVPRAVECLTWGHCQCGASVKAELLQAGVTDLSQNSSSWELFTELCIPAPGQSVQAHWRIYWTVNLGQSAAQSWNKLSQAKQWPAGVWGSWNNGAVQSQPRCSWETFLSRSKLRVWLASLAGERVHSRDYCSWKSFLSTQTFKLLCPPIPQFSMKF